MVATFRSPGLIVTGWGSLNELGPLAKTLGDKALLVTGRTALRRGGRIERVLGLLASAGVAAEVFGQVEPEPSTDTVDRGRTALRECAGNVVIAAGGGSAIDVGKAIAALAGSSLPTHEFYHRPLPPVGVPCIAVPTTAGTGAEATPNSVLIDTLRRLKESLRGGDLLPAAALVDAELTLTCPKTVTAAAGIDALTQAIESYLSIHATPLTEALSLHAAELIWPNLPVAFADGGNRPAREAMAYGSLLAGMALANARLGAVHGLAHSLGLHCHAPHGIVCGALLPHVLRFNRPAAADKLDRLGRLLGGEPEERTAWLLERLELPRNLRGYDLKEADLGEIARESLPSGSLKANPRRAGVAELIELMRPLL
jgi:alcohol dehydrogenase class IV